MRERIIQEVVDGIRSVQGVVKELGLSTVNRTPHSALLIYLNGWGEPFSWDKFREGMPAIDRTGSVYRYFREGINPNVGEVVLTLDATSTGWRQTGGSGVLEYKTSGRYSNAPGPYDLVYMIKPGLLHPLNDDILLRIV